MKAKNVTPQVKIRQIFFKPEQRKFLSPEFIPFDNSKSKTADWYEFGVMKQSYEENFHQTARYTGILSWRFSQKSLLSGKEFINFMNRNKGFDVYFVDPFPAEQLFYLNVWHQGDHHHPGIAALMQTILHKIGYKIDIGKIPFDESNIAYCNYWVGNKLFWDTYMKFALAVQNVILNDKYVHRQAFKDAQYHYRAPIVPFIMERLFSTVLALNPQITKCRFLYSPPQLSEKYKEYILGIKNLITNGENIHLNPVYFRMGYNLRHHPLRLIKSFFKRAIAVIRRYLDR